MNTHVSDDSARSQPRRALVTGASGFVGRWLVSALNDAGHEVTGLATDNPLEQQTPRNTPAFPSSMHWHIGDIRDAAHLHAALAASQPHIIVHLAAISHVPTAASDPALAWDINVTSTARLLHEVVKLRDEGNIDPKVLVVGSGEQYGRNDALELLDESAPFFPRTVYAATKCAQETMALQQWRASGLRVVVARSFNHSGPGQETRFLLPALVSRALALRNVSGERELRLGNLTPVRDFLHVRDVVSAYISLCERGTAGEVYNVASGIGRSVRDVANRILERVGVSAALVEDSALVRPVDVPSLVGDSRKLQRAVNWRATKTFDDLIDDLIDAATH